MPKDARSGMVRRSIASLRTAGPLRAAYERSPRVQPLAREAYALVTRRPLPRFFGWLMTTHHELPWVDEHRWGTFRQAAEDVKSLTFTDPAYVSTIDALLWRHWNVAYAMVHAIEHGSDGAFNAVECGTHDGITIFFALRELEAAREAGKVTTASVHLYDAWAAMRSEELLEAEQVREGWYADLAIDRTRKNLEPFADLLTFHQGFIPDSLTSTGPAPEEISYLHIDLNAAGPTLAACEFFWPRLRRGGVALFDDYGWLEYAETKQVVDAFFADKPGTLMKLPTGQAIYFR